MNYKCSHHDREEDRSLLEWLDEPEWDKAGDLDQGEQMDTWQWHLYKKRRYLLAQWDKAGDLDQGEQVDTWQQHLYKEKTTFISRVR